MDKENFVCAKHFTMQMIYEVNHWLASEKFASTVQGANLDCDVEKKYYLSKDGT